MFGHKVIKLWVKHGAFGIPMWGQFKAFSVVRQWPGSNVSN